MSKNKRYIKYSIEDREKYYGNTTFEDTSKSRYGIGYYIVLKSGKMPKNLNSYNKDTIAGMKQAYKSLCRSKRIKF